MLRRVVAGAFLAATLLGVAPRASAHATLDRSSPPDGATVDRAPDEVWAEFTEPLAPSSTMRITDHCGRVSDDGNVRIQVTRMTIGMTATAPSTYTVTWRTTSMVDGHSADGYWTFTVAGARAPCNGAAPPTTQAPAPTPAPSAQGGGSGGVVSSPTTQATTSSPGDPVDGHNSTDDTHGAHGDPDALPNQPLHGAARGGHSSHGSHGSGSSGADLPTPVDQGSSTWLWVGVPGVLLGGLAPLIAGRTRARSA